MDVGSKSVPSDLTTERSLSRQATQIVAVKLHQIESVEYGYVTSTSTAQRLVPIRCPGVRQLTPRLQEWRRVAANDAVGHSTKSLRDSGGEAWPRRSKRGRDRR